MCKHMDFGSHIKKKSKVMMILLLNKIFYFAITLLISKIYLFTLWTKSDFKVTLRESLLTDADQLDSLNGNTQSLPLDSYFFDS